MSSFAYIMACHIGWYGGAVLPAPFFRQVEKFHVELDRKTGKHMVVIDDPKSSVPAKATWVVFFCPNDVVYVRPISREFPIS